MKLPVREKMGRMKEIPESKPERFSELKNQIDLEMDNLINERGGRK